MTRLTLAAVAALLAGAGMAGADDRPVRGGPYVGTTPGEIAETLWSEGYGIEGIERDDGLFEVEAHRDGLEVEFLVDPKSGLMVAIDDDEPELVRRAAFGPGGDDWYDDDDDDDDDDWDDDDDDDDDED